MDVVSSFDMFLFMFMLEFFFDYWMICNHFELEF